MARSAAARRLKWARARLRLLARDTHGATLVEFAFIVGPLIGLLVAILQTSLTYFAQQNINTTAEKATRLLMTGSAQQAGMTQPQFKAAVCTRLPAFMKCANVIVDVQTASSFSAANTGNPTITFDGAGNVSNTWAFDPGDPGEITIARVMYVWDVSKGPLGFDLSTMSSGKRLLVSTSVFKTEPYR